MPGCSATAKARESIIGEMAMSRSARALVAALVEAGLALEDVHRRLVDGGLQLAEEQQAVPDDDVELDLVRAAEDFAVVVEFVFPPQGVLALTLEAHFVQRLVEPVVGLVAARIDAPGDAEDGLPEGRVRRHPGGELAFDGFFE